MKQILIHYMRYGPWHLLHVKLALTPEHSSTAFGSTILRGKVGGKEVRWKKIILLNYKIRT